VGPTQTVITAPACRKVGPDQAVTPANHTNQVEPDQADQVGPDQAVRANRSPRCCRIAFTGFKHAACGGVGMAESVVLVACPLVPIPLAARGLAAVLAGVGPAGALVADAAPRVAWWRIAEAHNRGGSCAAHLADSIPGRGSARSGLDEYDGVSAAVLGIQRLFPAIRHVR
jgi:hypothetical protein